MTPVDPLLRLSSSDFRAGEHWTVNPFTGCWEWLKWRDEHGYGHSSRGRAHRAVYLQFGGEIPEGFDLHHRCENRACVNPEHLEPLGRSEHQRRHAQAWSSLSWDDVREIRRRAHAAEPIDKLATEYGLSLGTISPLIAGRTWPEGGYEPPAFVRDCAWCGETFVARRTNQRHCSREHRYAYKNSLRSAA